MPTGADEHNQSEASCLAVAVASKEYRQVQSLLGHHSQRRQECETQQDKAICGIRIYIKNKGIGQQGRNSRAAAQSFYSYSSLCDLLHLL
jgi:hypothetical protein